MKCSIIVSCHNCAYTLPIQIEVLSGQCRNDECEIIVVDNGSRDETVSVAKKLRHSIPNLRVLQANERKGFAHARNSAAQSAEGRFVLFCDGNDVAHNRWVESMSQALEKHPFVAGRLITTEINLPWTIAARPPEMQIEATAAVETFGHLPWASAANIGITRDLFDQCGGFNEELTALEDIDFSWRIQESGVDLTPVSESIVHYRLRNTMVGIFHQSLVYALNFVRLSDLHQENGFSPPKPSFFSIIWTWLSTVFSLFSFRRQHRGRLMWILGWSTGSLIGIVKCRWLGRSPSASKEAQKAPLLRAFKSKQSPKQQPQIFP
ncbi:MAG TPA: glycosyltransferase [Opitutales bacterium]|nr:glycosyltransferase [Opitutales bacterium]